MFSSYRHYFQRFGHIPALIILQLIFIILFAKFVVYEPHHPTYDNDQSENKIKNYPMFQDVHVMIFVGFGFLMTFLKKYGLSAVSLNMMCAVVAIEWATLMIGFFHMKDHYEFIDKNGALIVEDYSSPKIYLNLNTLLLSDFATASVLITFGVVIGTTSPLQLIVMTLIEITLFTINEIIGREYFGAIDAGDSIYVHLFGAYFGLAVSKMLYTGHHAIENEKKGSGYTSDLFSMIGTIFLWVFWPSFNSGGVGAAEPQQRAILNTYFALCSSVMAAFAMSAVINKENKFVMEHIQNATLAGGVAVGAVADLLIQPFGALIIGAIAGCVSVLGFAFTTPWLASRFKIQDTCGAHNLHGIPGFMALIWSIIMASVATKETYGEGLTDVYPLMGGDNPITPGKQALNQFLAGLVTLIIAIVGGSITGLILRFIGKMQHLEDSKPGSTIIKLLLNVGNVFTKQVGVKEALPKDAFFDDNLFFVVHENEHHLMVKSGNQIKEYDLNGEQTKF